MLPIFYGSVGGTVTGSVGGDVGVAPTSTVFVFLRPLSDTTVNTLSPTLTPVNVALVLLFLVTVNTVSSPLTNVISVVASFGVIVTVTSAVPSTTKSVDKSLTLIAVAGFGDVVARHTAFENGHIAYVCHAWSMYFHDNVLPFSNVFIVKMLS